MLPVSRFSKSAPEYQHFCRILERAHPVLSRGKHCSIRDDVSPPRVRVTSVTYPVRDSVASRSSRHIPCAPSASFNVGLFFAEKHAEALYEQGAVEALLEMLNMFKLDEVFLRQVIKTLIPLVGQDGEEAGRWQSETLRLPFPVGSAVEQTQTWRSQKRIATSCDLAASSSLC